MRATGRRNASAAAIAVVLMLALGARGGPATVTAQEATAVGTPAAARPVECRVAPRPLPPPTATPLEIVTPPPAQPTPFAVPDGSLADAETARAIEAVARESVACRNAGDFPRAYALFTDRFVAALLGPPDTLDPDLLARLALPPTPVPRAERLTLDSVTEVRSLADGRVGAIIVTRNAEQVYADYLYFVDQDGRWLIDERVFLADMDAVTPTP